MGIHFWSNLPVSRLDRNSIISLFLVYTHNYIVWKTSSTNVMKNILWVFTMRIVYKTRTYVKRRNLETESGQCFMICTEATVAETNPSGLSWLRPLKTERWFTSREIEVDSEESGNKAIGLDHIHFRERYKKQLCFWGDEIRKMKPKWYPWITNSYKRQTARLQMDPEMLDSWADGTRCPFNIISTLCCLVCWVGER